MTSKAIKATQHFFSLIIYIYVFDIYKYHKNKIGHLQLFHLSKHLNSVFKIANW